jgi:predicted acetyltransferase
MPQLAVPGSDVRSSFLAAMAEFQAEGRGTADDPTMLGRELHRYGGRWSAPHVFEEYVRWLRAQASETSPRPAGHVPSTTLWWVDDTTYLGRVAIRHRLTPSLRVNGGHIGYDIRPTARRRGHATALLRAALPVARRLVIDPALLTCDVDNAASRLVIERNGGVLDGPPGATLRYWVATG